MSNVFIPTRFQWRKDTSANWASNNPIPLQGEPCLETDTGYFKIGDGTTDYSSLPYAGNPAASVPITDVGGFFTGTDVEAALQELGAGGAGGGGAGTDLKTTAQFYDECHLASVTTAGWVADNASGSLSVQQTVSDMVGAYAARCGASTGTRGSATAPGFKVIVGAGQIRCRFRVRPEHAPDASNQFQYSVGVVNNLTTSSSDRIMITAVDGLAGWCLQYINPSGNLTSSTTLPVVAGVTINLDLVINAAGNSVSFFADDVLIDTLALPYSFVPMHPMFLSRKNGVNGGQSSLWIDKVLVEQDQ